MAMSDKAAKFRASLTADIESSKKKTKKQKLQDKEDGKSTTKDTKKPNDGIVPEATRQSRLGLGAKPQAIDKNTILATKIGKKINKSISKKRKLTVEEAENEDSGDEEESKMDTGVALKRHVPAKSPLDALQNSKKSKKKKNKKAKQDAEKTSSQTTATSATKKTVDKPKDPFGTRTSKPQPPTNTKESFADDDFATNWVDDGKGGWSDNDNNDDDNSNDTTAPAASKAKANTTQTKNKATHHKDSTKHSTLGDTKQAPKPTDGSKPTDVSEPVQQHQQQQRQQSSGGKADKAEKFKLVLEERRKVATAKLLAETIESVSTGAMTLDAGMQQLAPAITPDAIKALKTRAETGDITVTEALTIVTKTLSIPVKSQRKKRRSKQKNIKKDTRAQHLKPTYLTPGDEKYIKPKPAWRNLKYDDDVANENSASTTDEKQPSKE
eukprot:m.176404 g.176404  ORF g.176404 m.176404 type:complete len:439 (-) comp31847_c7_seq2:258-1574(-)